MPTIIASASSGIFKPSLPVDATRVIGPSVFDGANYHIPTLDDAFVSNLNASLGIVEILKTTDPAVSVGADFFGAHLNPDGAALDRYPAQFSRLRSVDFDPASGGVFHWRDIQPAGVHPGNGGPFVWDVVDEFARVCKSKGYTPFITLHGTPDWAVESSPWTTGEAVAVGVVRSNAGNYYTAITAGNCGATAPTHTGATGTPLDVSDGGVTWRSAAQVVNGYGGKSNLPPTMPGDMYNFAEAVGLRLKNVHGIDDADFEIFNEVNLSTHWAGTNLQMADCVKQAFFALNPLGFRLCSPNLWFGGAVTLAEHVAIVDAYITTLNTVSGGGGTNMWKYCDSFGIHTYSMNPSAVRNLHLGINYLKSRINAVLVGANAVGVSRNAMPIIDNEHGTNGCPTKEATIMQRVVMMAGLGVKATFYYHVSLADGSNGSLGLGKYYSAWNEIREILMSGPLTLVNILPNGAVSFIVGGKNYLINWREVQPLEKSVI